MIINTPKVMSNISTYFNLRIRQDKLDFVDVKLDDDNLLFINPRLIEIGGTKTAKMSNNLSQFYGNLILSITTGNKKNSFALLSGIKEPKETRLGYGHKNSDGNSVGPILQQQLIDAIITNPILKKKAVKTLNDISFFIHDIGPDRISDLTTKVIKEHLIRYTQQQCKKHNIKTEQVNQQDVFNAKTLEWNRGKYDLPVYTVGKNKKPIIFVPKKIVYRETDAKSTSQSFYRFARNYIMNQNPSKLIEIPTSGKDGKLQAKDVDAYIEDIKYTLGDWVNDHPNILDGYWTDPRYILQPLSNKEIEEVVYS